MTKQTTTSPGLGIFPCRLQQILADCEEEGNECIASWLPCGTLFKIYNSKEFADTVMPKYFRHSRYKSFLRQLSMYKFQRITDGPNRGAYGHPQFIRGRKDLCCNINRAIKISHSKESKGEEVETLSARTVSYDDFNVVSPSVSPTVLGVQEGGEDFTLDFHGLAGNLQQETMSPDDWKLVQHTISWTRCSNTPDDILNEIIITFNGPKRDSF